jgi:hypothetical protein
MKMTREELDRLLASGARVRKPVADVPAPAAPDHTVFVEKITSLVERMSEMNMEQLARIESAVREMRRPPAAVAPAPAPAPAPFKPRRMKVNRNARGFIESIDVEEA